MFQILIERMDDINRHNNHVIVIFREIFFINA